MMSITSLDIYPVLSVVWLNLNKDKGKILGFEKCAFFTKIKFFYNFWLNKDIIIKIYTHIVPDFLNWPQQVGWPWPQGQGHTQLSNVKNETLIALSFLSSTQSFIKNLLLF